MQQGSLIRSNRKRGPGVWQFRWAERGPQGNASIAKESSAQCASTPMRILPTQMACREVLCR
jgi:hypothetical protein